MKIIIINKISLILLLFLTGNKFFAQTTFVNVGKVTVASETFLKLENVSNKNYGNFIVTGNLEIFGNLENIDDISDEGEEIGINTPTFTGAGVVSLLGVSKQNIFGNSPITVLNLVVDNVGVNLTNDLSITNTADFQSGIIAVGDQSQVIFTENATWSNASDSSHIDGAVTKIFGISNTEFVFPTGDDKKYAEAGIINLSGANSLTSFSARYFNEEHSDTENFDENAFTNISKLEYWSINKLAGEHTNLGVSLHWDNAEESGIGDPQQLQISRYDINGWSKICDAPEISASENKGSISTTTAMLNLGDFTIASVNKDINPLPIELLTFYATAVDNAVVLEWATASEKNNNYFEIERSTNAVDFDNIGLQLAAGNSNKTLQYQHNDYNVESGTTYYYRLKQVDYDGKYSYSPVRSIKLNYEKEIFDFYPNPVETTIFILTEADFFNIEIISESGAIVKSTSNSKEINVDCLPNGLYIMKFITGTSVEFKKFIKIG
ncbi:T9SS type A sorting domain-containing protein [Bacteroidales bacterium OttesenSCG-928-I21]|nr:T9SS type A sorting domain-containing protein [Bacteroidales bacterium OttesenSCG-928-I21]